MKLACLLFFLVLNSILLFGQNADELFLKSKKLFDASNDEAAGIILNEILAKKNIPYKLEAEVYNLLGHIELNKGNLPASLKHYIRLEKIALDHNDLDLIVQSDVSISGIYREQNNFVLAFRYIRKAENSIDKIQDKKVAGNFYNNKAILLEMSNESDSAIIEYNKALAIYMSIPDSNHIAIGYNNLGIVYKNKGNYKRALANYFKVVDMEKRIGNKYILAASYINIGGVYAKLKNANEAIAYNKIGLQIAREIPAQYLIVSAADNLADGYFELKKIDSTYYWLKVKFVENEKYLNTENSKQINELQAKYETEKKEHTISLQLNKLTKQKLLLVGGTILFTLMLLSGYLFYRRYKLKKEKELQETLLQQREEATISILTAEEKERKRIASDLHDGVGQLMTAAWLNLQVLEKQTDSTSSSQQQLLAKTTLLVGESCKEVRQVSHNMMPNALLKRGLINAIKEFTQQLDTSVLSINLHSQGLNMGLDSITETILYRVIQESVNNAIKHAAATELDISINNSDEGIDVLIEDNGRGFDTSLIGKVEDGLGLQNVISRITFLNGTVDWDSSPGNGTVVAIHIPPKI
jgi:signal transduction histidine kinase